MNQDQQDTIARLREVLTGPEPPDTVVADIGGWEVLNDAARILTDNPMLSVVTNIVCRDLDPTAPASVQSAKTLVDVVAATSDAMTFAATVDTMCESAAFLDIAGDQLAGACFSLAGPPARQDLAESQESQRAAEALEALTRLSLVGHGSRHKVLGLLTDIHTPQPPRYARAVLRTIGAAYDHWEAVDDVIPVVAVVAEPGGAADGDAEWTGANIEVARALRASTATTALEHFRRARTRLATINSVRDDARLLDQVLGHLEALMEGAADGGDAPVTTSALRFEQDKLDALMRDAEKFALTSAGLGHWAGNRKRVVIGSWVRLAEDLTWMANELDRDVFYEVAVVVDRIAQIYDAAHSYDVTAHHNGVGIIADVVRPTIEGGFVQRAALMRHLSDHAEALEIQEAAGTDVGGRLASVRVLLGAARDRLMSSSEPPGKAEEQAAVPPLLADLLEGKPDLLARLGSALAADDLAHITAAVATYQHISRTEPDLAVEAVIENIVRELQNGDEFTGEVAHAVARVVRVLTLFVAAMTDIQKSAAPWLFEASVPESTLHEHLLQWLRSNHFRQRASSEVQSVAGGRLDIQFSFEGFRLVAELKVDTTHVPVEDKPKYIRQVAAYGNTDVKIGFLVVLRTPAKGATNLDDLAGNVTHTTVDGAGGAGDRHVVMFDIPGNRTPPSAQ